MTVEFAPFYRGDDHALRIRIRHRDENGVKQNTPITGWQFQCTMKLSPEDPDSAAPVRVDTGPLDTPEAANGELVILLPHEQTQNCLPTKYWLDIQRVFEGSVRTLVMGRIRVLADNTRRTGE